MSSISTSKSYWTASLLPRSVYVSTNPKKRSESWEEYRSRVNAFRSLRTDTEKKIRAMGFSEKRFATRVEAGRYASRFQAACPPKVPLQVHEQFDLFF